MRLSSRQLEIFHVACRLRSARRTAEALHVSQPSVSRAIADLEIEVGVKLFDRSGRGFEPTLAARALFEAVERHYSGIERIVEIAEMIRTGTHARLRVAALPVLADGDVARAAGRVMARHPSIRIDLEVEGELGCIQALRAGKADVAILSKPLDDIGLTNRHLGRISAVAVLPRGDPLSGNDRIPLVDIVSGGILALPSGSSFRAQLESACAALGVELVVRAEARTQAALAEMVQAGAGRSILAWSACRTLGIEAITRPLDPEMTWDIWMSWRLAEANSAAVTLLANEFEKATG